MILLAQICEILREDTGVYGLCRENNAKIINCVFNGNLAVYYGGEMSNYNCVQGWTGGLGGSGNHEDDPLFVDANGIDNIAGTEDDNLRLSKGSACFDAGDNTVVPPDDADLDGDGNVDMDDLLEFTENWLWEE